MKLKLCCFFWLVLLVSSQLYSEEGKNKHIEFGTTFWDVKTSNFEMKPGFYVHFTKQFGEVKGMQINGGIGITTLFGRVNDRLIRSGDAYVQVERGTVDWRMFNLLLPFQLRKAIQFKKNMSIDIIGGISLQIPVTSYSISKSTLLYDGNSDLNPYKNEIDFVVSNEPSLLDNIDNFGFTIGYGVKLNYNNFFIQGLYNNPLRNLKYIGTLYVNNPSYTFFTFGLGYSF